MDVFFHVPHGRLKLRRIRTGADEEAELIWYQRPDGEGPRTSNYQRVPVPDPDALEAALGGALGVRGRVVKERLLLLTGQTRIHLDRVEGLGDFLELEVVLEPGQEEVEGRAVAAELAAWLGVQEEDLVRVAYMDLLEG